jgi:inositol polyphosphate 5-phosphatase INPP5B/F
LAVILAILVANLSAHQKDKDISMDSTDDLMPGAFPGPSKSELDAEATHQTLTTAVYSRRAEFTRPKSIRIKVGTWNVAAFKGPEQDIKGWFIEGKGVTEALAGLTIANKSGGADQNSKDEDNAKGRETPEAQERRRTSDKPTIPKGDKPALPGGEEIGIYVLGLQEVVDITSATEALRPYTDPSTANKYKAAIKEALPSYELVAEQQLIGLLLLIYASPSVAPDVKSVSTTSVGTGLMGYMGNKGAVTARLVLGETTRLVFVNCHLNAGADKASLERRNWDANQITTRTRFDPITDSLGITQSRGEALGEEDFAFWFGDLNYRLEGMPGDDVRHLLSLHVRNEYSLPSREVSRSSRASEESSISGLTSSPRLPSPSRFDMSHNEENNEDDNRSHYSRFSSEEDRQLPADLDPTSLQTTLTSLLSHDELHQQQRLRKAFHDGWREGPIKFLPTYKYDVGTVATFDSSEKRRCPSWCDRILYRTRRDKLDYDDTIRDEEEARKKDAQMKQQGTDKAGEEDSVLYDYDPETDAADEYDEFAYDEPILVETKEGFEDEIQLEYYAAHQRVLSSDHKPLDAVFAFKYDAVIPELKAKVHQEVAKDLDRSENESRPTITVLVDQRGGAAYDGSAENSEGIDFGNVKFAQSKRRSITIANTGRVPAVVGFVDRPIQEGKLEGPTPPWLSIRFDREPDKKDGKTDATASNEKSRETYTLEPGDVCNVELTLKVEVIALIRSLNKAETKLEDILVLRVLDGRDHFLPLRGRWMTTSLGHSIDKLIRIPEGGIRKLQGQKPKGKEGCSRPTSSASGNGNGSESLEEVIRSP